MIEHDSTHPPYGWARNKGYASEEHRDALLERGATDLHRRTWLTKLFGDPSRAEGSAA
jgi:ribonuclease HII